MIENNTVRSIRAPVPTKVTYDKGNAPQWQKDAYRKSMEMNVQNTISPQQGLNNDNNSS